MAGNHRDTPASEGKQAHLESDQGLWSTEIYGHYHTTENNENCGISGI
jgi:hypothetical protein